VRVQLVPTLQVRYTSIVRRLLAVLFVLAWAVPSARAGGDTVVLNVAGDVGYPNGWKRIDRVDRDKHRLFRAIAPIIASGDLNFVNLEGPYTSSKPTVKKTYPMACKPARLGYVVRAGFNLFSVANNHSLDAGKVGVTDTLATLRRLNRKLRPLWWAGTGATHAAAIRGVRVRPPGKTTTFTLFAVNNGGSVLAGSIFDPGLVRRVRRAAKHTIVLVSVHKGWEYYHVPRKAKVRRYHRLIDAGATVVIGHHPHILQGVERYKRGLIFYSLGNLSFGSYTTSNYDRRARMYSMIGRLTFRGGKLAEAELIPLYVGNKDPWVYKGKTIPPRFATPQLLSGVFADFALNEITDFTRRVPLAPKATRLIRFGDRAFVDLGHGVSAKRRTAARRRQAAEWANVVRLGLVPRTPTKKERHYRNVAGTPKQPWRYRHYDW